MKPPRIDITAGEASDSALRDVTTGLLTAWGTSSAGMFLASGFGYEWPAWAVFNPLILIGMQGSAVIYLWGVPFVILNLVVTWRLVFNYADRIRSAIVLAGSCAIIGIGTFHRYEISAFWRHSGEYVILALNIVVIIIVACGWLLWPRRWTRK